MPFLVCVVPVSPIRAEASHRSEQVSQLLFGETCEQLERTNGFIRIRVVFDNYEGWCQETQLEETSDETISSPVKLAAAWVNTIQVIDQQMTIPFGASIPTNNLIGTNQFTYNGATIDPSENSLNEDLLKKYTHTFLNTSYLWGGRSVFGVDCSGFTQLVFKCLNIPLLRDASQQVTQGDEVGFLEEVKYGDLAFFDNEAGRIVHVGILLSRDTIIHASGRVRIDKIDSVGIVNHENSKRTHKLRVIKRMASRMQKLF